MTDWLIYGANGYTGQLIAAEAVRRGMRPVLAGRSRASVEALGSGPGSQYDLPTRVFDLGDATAIARGLQQISLVLNCAGPFSTTCEPLLDACLVGGAHYVDITGEIDVFAHCHAQDRRARERRMVILPGAGFDVVPTDCVAGLLKRELPDATSLVLAFEAAGGASPGTSKTGIEGLARGGRIRRDGKLESVPLAYKTRTFDRDGQARSAMTIPWGDLYTAWVSTGIPDIETYLAVSPKSIAAARRMNRIRRLLQFPGVVPFLQRRIASRVKGPDAITRANTRARIWGEVRDAAGELRQLQIDTPNGYELTVTGALGIVEHLLADTVDGGYYTPAMLMGPEYVLQLPGVEVTS
ncbi:MAG: saccharopine dehydrogenase NADP-binding domain-containing protein [Gammaproteobacteria bacterium]